MASRAASAGYPVECPTCGAEPMSPCRTKKTLRVTDTHASRSAAYWQFRERALAERRSEHMRQQAQRQAGASGAPCSSSIDEGEGNDATS
ncbi:zinc finger domain-containing protein [Gordonia sihwensis]|uniref:zinc finger domain-containing protein n=1 Tax=Gordonia sihwensis TaxID=173559 RepID=UPI003D9930E1